MRPQPPNLVFGDLQQWLQTHRVDIGRVKLDPEAFEDKVQQQQASKKQCLQQKRQCEIEYASPVTTPPIPLSRNMTASVVEKPVPPEVAKAAPPPVSHPVVQKPIGKAGILKVQTTLTLAKENKQDQKENPLAKTAKHKIKTPIGTPQVLIRTQPKLPYGRDGRFQNFTQWCALRKSAELCRDPLPNNETERTVDIAEFSRRRIDQLTQMYSMKKLPNGAAVGDYAMCLKLQGREVRHIPAFLPTKQTHFGMKKHELQCVIGEFQKLWFRVSFVAKDKDSDEIVHFKDLQRENSFLALKPHLHALFVHLAHGNSALLEVFAFALESVSF